MSNVLITGASGGIGLATARAFAEKGHNLALFGFKNFDSLKAEAVAISDTFHVEVNCYKADVSNPKEVKEAIAKVLTYFKKIDILVNNAGMSIVGLDIDMNPETWRQICDVNLSSAMYFTRELMPSMIHEKSGKIINISSMWGVRGASCEAAYSATKGALNAYTKALGKELAPSGISVNALALGAIDTKMNSHLSADEKAEFEEEIPFGRMATPKEAADMIVLLSEAPAYLTAQVIGFDGGY